MTTSPNDEKMSVLQLLQRIERIRAEANTEEGTEAQRFFFDAWEISDDAPEQATELLMCAIELDPTNVDAWLKFIQYLQVDRDEYIQLLRQLVSMGERNLGEITFTEDKGHFWGLIETRSYMRARQELARSLMKAGRLEESVVEHEAMLELNSNDNQGMRYGLLTLYLALNQPDKAEQLFQQFDEREFSTVYAWGDILTRFLKQDLPGALNALQNARRQNRHAQAYFLENRKPPKNLPDAYRPQSKEEAIFAWDIQKLAWQRHPEAQAWLREQCQK